MDYNFQEPIGIIQKGGMAPSPTGLEGLPPELLVHIYQYCPEDLSSSPSVVKERCERELTFRRALNMRGLFSPPGVPPSEAFRVYRDGGKFIPLVVDGQEVYLPVYSTLSTFNLLEEVSSYARGGRVYGNIPGNTPVLLGTVHPTLLASTAPPTLSFPRKRNFLSAFTGLPPTLFNDIQELYVV